MEAKPPGASVDQWLMAQMRVSTLPLAWASPQSPSEGLDHHRKARVWEMVPEEPGTVS